MASIRQVAANRSNAELSTGPRTEEGKARSRANGQRHGLAGAGEVVPGDDAGLVEQRMETWRARYAPADDAEEWLLRQVAVNSVKLDRCRREEDAHDAHQSLRARLCWDDDRRRDAEELGARLAKDPARVRRRLEETPQGAEWLLERWRALGGVLEAGGAWTDPQEALAHDLLGNPPALRQRPAWEPLGSPSALVAAEVERLEVKIVDELHPIDDLNRHAAEAGVPLRHDRARALIRRYEAACLRRLLWAEERLLKRPAPAPAAATAPVTAPEPPTIPAPKPPGPPAAAPPAPRCADEPPAGPPIDHASPPPPRLFESADPAATTATFRPTDPPPLNRRARRAALRRLLHQK